MGRVARGLGDVYKRLEKTKYYKSKLRKMAYFAS